MPAAIVPPLTIQLAVLALGAALIESGTLRRAALTGVVAFAAGAAAFAVVPGGTTAAEIAGRVRLQGLPVAFAAVNVGALLLGVGLVTASAIRAIARVPRTEGPAAVVSLAGVGASCWAIAPLVRAAGGWPSVAAALGLAAGALGLYGLGRLSRVATVVRWLDARVLAPHGAVAWPAPADRALLAAGALGAALVAAGPHAVVVAGGLLIVAAAAYGYHRRHGIGPRVPGLLIVTLLLVPALWFLATVAGPVGLAVATLPEVPLSPAAQRLLALPVALVVWAWFGLWPLHGVTYGSLLAPLGAALWVRVGEPAAGEGLLHWQPLLAPLALAGLWYAALVRAGAAGLAALALVALVALRPASTAAAVLLLAAAVGTVIAPAVAKRWRGYGRAAVLVAGAIGAALALRAGFEAQVVYTVGAAAGLALLAWRATPR